MASKYEEVNKVLPRRLPQDEDERPERRQRIDALKTKLAAEGVASAAEISRRYAVLRKQKAEIEELLSPVQEQLDAVSELLISVYEEAGVSSVRVAETGESVSMELVPMPQVKDRDALRKWYVDNGMEQALAPHPSSLASLVKEQLLAGLAIPDGVEAYARAKIVLRKK